MFTHVTIKPHQFGVRGVKYWSPVLVRSRSMNPGQEMTVLCDRLRVARGVRSCKREPHTKAGDASGLGPFPLVAAKLKD